MFPKTALVATIAAMACGLMLTAAADAGEAEMKKDAKFKRDRQAILDMAGQYDVEFRFFETVPIKSGYEPREPFKAGATELVKVIEDTGERIVLQRLLLVGDKDDRAVVKHWRQTWQYEPEVIYEFRGDRTWVPREIPDAQAKGQWRETVSQVDDSPRYAGLGRWTHTQNLSAWQSNKTWRPMPRREQKRDREYDVLVSRNRYTQTATGWAHEQDSYKLVLKNGKPHQILTREVGLNTYNRVNDVDFSAVNDYWQRTAPFWEQVRDAWAKVYAKRQPIHLKAEVDGKTLWQHMFERAGEIEKANDYDKKAAAKFIDQTLREFLDNAKGGEAAKKIANEQKKEAEGATY